MGKIKKDVSVTYRRALLQTQRYPITPWASCRAIDGSLQYYIVHTTRLAPEFQGWHVFSLRKEPVAALRHNGHAAQVGVLDDSHG